MKIIEAMKKIKDLQRKCEDIRKKVRDNCADLSIHTPLYEEPRKKVDGWLQSHADMVQEICRLRVAIQRTNLQTNVPIEVGEKVVIKTIAEWIHRKRDLAKLDALCWAQLSDRGYEDKTISGATPESPVVEVKIRRYYDPELKDRKIDEYQSEALSIDSRLEVINAVTDLVE